MPPDQRAYAGVDLTLINDPEIDELIGPADPTNAGVPVPAAVSVPAVGAGGEQMIGFGPAWGAYEGADRFSKELALWMPPLASADFDTLFDKPALDARARDAVRNDAYVAAGAEIHKNSIVGAQYLLNCKPETKILGLDDTWEEEYQEEVETKFHLWAESDQCWVDKTRLLNFTAIVRMCAGLMVTGGEFLASGEWMKDGRPFQTAVQLIDTDRLSNPWGQWNNPRLRGGVVKNDDGIAVGYQIRRAHPVDFTNFATFDAYKWDLIPAETPWGRRKIIHILDPWRVDQSRGLAKMVSALNELRMAKKFREVVLQNAILNATYAASIESDLPSETVFTQLGGGNLGEVAMQQAIMGYAQAYLGAIKQYAGGAKNLAIDGAKIPHLFPGTKLQLRPAGSGGPLGTDFEASINRYLAAALGVSYEQFTGDLTGVNYASFKAGAGEVEKGMRSAKRRGADRCANAIFRLWLEEAISTGEITSMSKKAPSIYDSNGRLGMNFDAYAACEWIGAGKGQVDELKETQAAIQRILFGLSTYETELARLRGADWRKVFRQIKREKLTAAQLDILQNLQSNMMNATTGATRNKEPGEGSTDTGVSGGNGGSGGKK